MVLTPHVPSPRTGMVKPLFNVRFGTVDAIIMPFYDSPNNGK